MLIGWLLFRFHLPTSPVGYLIGAVSVVLAVVVSFLWRYLVSLSAFWLVDVRGVLGLATFVGTLLNGLAIPVSWFPPWLRTIAWCTPFPTMIQVPADLLTGRVGGGPALGLLAAQVGWALLLMGAGRWVLARGTRHLVVQGG
jgi:ABC-2 type transport system permease protein